MDGAMFVALAFCSKDRGAALDWMAHTGKFNQKNHTLVLFDASGEEPEIIGRESWKEVIHVPVYPVTSNWKSDASIRDAAGPNSMFRAAAEWFLKAGHPFLWMETDAVLVVDGGFDTIEAEYEACGKPYMGAIVVSNGLKHMSGIAVYPAKAGQETAFMLPMRYGRNEIAWDLASSKLVVSRAHNTALIHHRTRGNTEPWRTSAFICHPCKDGSLFMPKEVVEENPDEAPVKIEEETETIVGRIRFHVNALADIVGEVSSRKIAVHRELRAAKLMAKASGRAK